MFIDNPQTAGSDDPTAPPPPVASEAIKRPRGPSKRRKPTFYDEGSHLVAEVRVQVVRDAAPTAAGPINQPALCARFFNDVVVRAAWYDPEKECCVVLLLTRKNKLKGWNLISLGSLTAALLHPREVFRPAVVASAAAIVVMHNHPSGDPAPSAPDLHVTRQLREAAKAVDIELVDHVIVGRPADDPLARGWFSFREAGLL